MTAAPLRARQLVQPSRAQLSCVRRARVHVLKRRRGRARRARGRRADAVVVCAACGVRTQLSWHTNVTRGCGRARDARAAVPFFASTISREYARNAAEHVHRMQMLDAELAAASVNFLRSELLRQRAVVVAPKRAAAAREQSSWHHVAAASSSADHEARERRMVGGGRQLNLLQRVQLAALAASWFFRFFGQHPL